MEETEIEPKPSDVGFGYIPNETVVQQATMKSDPNGQAGAPLRSALKTPGTPGRLLNPLSPTFREEQILEKEESKTEVSQAKDLVCFDPHFPPSYILANTDVRKSKPESVWPKWSSVVSTFHAHLSSFPC
jgi:hypothetical protein